MSISYHTNWMGPISMEWFRKRGLTKKASVVLEEGRIVYPEGLGAGDTWEYDKITTHYAGGRIDIGGLDEEKYYNGCHEYTLPIMHSRDWDALTDWLSTLVTDDLWGYDELIKAFEEHHGKKIRWWEVTESV